MPWQAVGQNGDARVQLRAVDIGADEWPTGQTGIAFAFGQPTGADFIFTVGGSVLSWQRAFWGK